MNRRDIKTRFTLFFLLISIVFLGHSFSSNIPKAMALGNVTLSASFHDDDAEDTHQASQWVVYEGVSVIFDSGTDAINKESITIDASYFTVGTTYTWKVRMQDQHDAWGDYSELSSFTYGTAPTATPTATSTSTPTATPTATPTLTASPTLTATPTGTVVPTTTPTSTGTVTPLPTATRDEYLMDAQVLVPNGGEIYLLGSTINFEYYADPSRSFEGYGVNSCISRPDAWYHDLYISTDGGRSYERVISNINYTDNCQFVGSEKGSKYIRVRTSWSIPRDQRLVGANAKMAVVVYKNDGSNNFGLGSKFTPGESWKGDRFRYMASDPSDRVFSIVTDELFIKISKPESKTVWKVGNKGQIAWSTNYTGELSPRADKVNILLSLDGGVAFNYQLAQGAENTGSFYLDTLNKYISDTAVVKIEGLDSTGRVITVANSEVFKIVPVAGGGVRRECNGCICVGPYCSRGEGVGSVLILGTLATLVLPYLLAVLSSLPLGMRFLGFLGPVSQQLFGGLLSKISFLKSVGEATGLPMFFPPTKKGRESWGVVYDSISKKPIVGAVVKIYTQFSGRLKDIKYTNKNGEFTMLVPSGSYRIVAVKPGYKFPSSIIISKKDGKYIDIYRGSVLDVKKNSGTNKAPINVSIPMDAVGFSLYEAIFATSVSFGRRFWSIVRYPLMAFGLVLSLYLAVQYNSLFQYAVFCLYVIIIIFDLRTLFRQKNFGKILDQKGRALDRVIVRALNKNGKIKGTVVTGDDGRFSFNLNPGQYAFVASRNGYATVKAEYVDISKVTDLSKVVLRLIKINKK